jgi:hypothetical protein
MEEITKPINQMKPNLNIDQVDVISRIVQEISRTTVAGVNLSADWVTFNSIRFV